MTSRLQIASNRRNARRSTGPRTIEGKQAVANNARQHGLTGRLVVGSEAFRQADELANALLGKCTHDPEAKAAARTYAEAQVKLDQIRRYRRTSLQAMLQLSLDAVDGEAAAQGATDQTPFDLSKLARYERMARAERRRALERLKGLIE